MKKITYFLALLSISALAQEQFPGEHEGNLIYNAGFEQSMAWGNNEKNDGVGWECWGCFQVEHESLQGYSQGENDYRIAVPAASGNYYGLSKPWEGTMFQIFEVEGNTQYTVKFKFGWMHYPNGSLSDKTINVVIKDASDNKNLDKMLLSEDNFYATNSTNGSFSGLFFDSWHDVEFTFTTKESTFDARFQIWNPNATPIYIIDNVEVFPTPAASINKFKNVDFKFSPNPTSDVLNLSASKNISSFQIYNGLGQKVMEKNINTLSFKINIESLKAGIYFLHASIHGATETYKFQKI